MLFRKPQTESIARSPSNIGAATIVTMPEQFLPPIMGRVGAQRMGGAIIAFGVVLLVGAGGWWAATTWFQGSNLTLPPPVTQSPPVTSVPEVTPPPADIGAPSPPQTVRASVVDATGTTVSSGRLLIGEGALGAIATVALEGWWPPEAERETTAGLIVSGVYRIQPRELAFATPVRLVIEYGPEVQTAFAELELRGAIWDAGTWRVLSNVIPDSVSDSVGFTVEGIPADGYALVKPSVAVLDAEPPEAQIPSTVLASGPDADRDGLTDEEERLFGSDPTRPDSDGDSFADGLEVASLYNPLAPPPGRLATSNLVNVYNNPTFGYALFAPAGFLVRATDQTNRDVLFTSSTGEFIEVSVQENAEAIDTETWFRRQFPDEPLQRLRQWPINGTKAIWSSDGTNMYLADRDKLFVLSYNVGGLERLNFRTTFEMLARSFRPTGAGLAPAADAPPLDVISGTDAINFPENSLSDNDGGPTPPAVP